LRGWTGAQPRNFAGHGGMPAAGDACAVTGCGHSRAAAVLLGRPVDGGRSVLRWLSARGLGVSNGQGVVARRSPRVRSPISRRPSLPVAGRAGPGGLDGQAEEGAVIAGGRTRSRSSAGVRPCRTAASQSAGAGTARADRTCPVHPGWPGTVAGHRCCPGGERWRGRIGRAWHSDRRR
jgi:hypothetical protein